MAQRPHILIIGGGLIGLASARSCYERGARVTLAERQPVTGHGAGFSNSGMIHPSQAWPWVPGALDEADQRRAARLVAKLAKDSVPLLKQRLASLGLADISRADGCYQIYGSQALRKTAVGRYEDIEVETRATHMFERPAVFFPHDFSGSAYDWSRAESDALKEDGVEIQTGAQVQLNKTGTQVQAHVNGRNIKADHIILCTGHKVNELLEPIGLNLPIKPVRGFALDFNINDLDLSDLPQAPVMDAATHSALTIFNGHLRLSGTLGELSATPLWQRWCELIPDMMSRLGSPQRIWSGNRPVSLLGRPIISQSPLQGLWINSGHGHMGWTLSMASAERIANMIFDEAGDAGFAWPQT